MVGSPTSLRATASYGEHHLNHFIDWLLTREAPESMASVASHTNGIDGHGLPSYDWSADHQQVQSYRSGFLSHGCSPISTTASRTATTAPTFNNNEHSLEELRAHRSQMVPHNCWGPIRAGPLKFDRPRTTSPTPFHRET